MSQRNASVWVINKVNETPEKIDKTFAHEALDYVVASDILILWERHDSTVVAPPISDFLEVVWAKAAKR